jgi:excisionase family DNA binding protein
MVTNGNRKTYNDDDMLTPQDIAAYLHISKPTAIKLIRQGNITGGQVGSRFRAYFKYVREFDEKTLKGGEIQRTLPLQMEAPAAAAKRKVKKTTKRKRP